jgi:hypothetical protein
LFRLFVDILIVATPHSGEYGESDAIGIAGFIPRQPREQAIQPDPATSRRGGMPTRASSQTPACAKFPTRNLLLIAREADLLGPHVGRIADPLLQLPAHLQPRQVQRA